MKKLLILFFLAAITVKATAQVNMQNGSAVFSLPMFSWQDDKSRLNSSVGLEYSSGRGLAVNEIASDVGQGWNLLAGGSITRIQVGEADDQKGYAGKNGGGVQDLTKYPDGYLYNSVPAAFGCPKALINYPLFTGKDQMYIQNNPVAADREQDYFSFQFGGHTGMFILNKSGTSANGGNTAGDIGIVLDDSKLKVWFTRNESMPGIRTVIDAFYIQDENGLIYKFQTLCTSTVQSQHYCDKTFTKVLNQPVFNAGGTYYQNDFDLKNLVNANVVNSWCLSEIDDPLTGRKITYTYGLVESINAFSGAGISYDAAKGYVVISERNTISQTPQLTAINYPDGHTVTLNYGAARVDLSGDQALASVDVQYQGRYVSKYALNTSYFLLNHCGAAAPSDYGIARLCLLGVKKYGPDLKEDEPPYTFTYNMGSSTTDDFIPPPFCGAKDIWGYYNGNNCLSDDGTSIASTVAAPFTYSKLASLSFTQLKGLCFLYQSTPSQPITNNFSTVNANYAKNGLLKTISYPTGGTLTYAYAQNASKLNGNPNTPVGGVHVISTSTTDGGYQYSCTNPPMVTHYNFIDASNNSSLWGFENPVNAVSDTSFYQAEQRKLRYRPIFNFSCYWNFQYPGIIQPTDDVPLSTLMSVMQAIAPELAVVSALSEALDIIKAVTGGSVVGLIIDVVAAVLDVIFTCFGDAQIEISPDTVYYSDNINGSNPLPEQFDRVEVVQGDGGAGKAVSQFTDATDYPIWVPKLNALSRQQRYAPWAYGLPKEDDVYDASGNIVKQTINNYDTSLVLQNFSKNISTGNPNYLNEHTSCKCLVTYSTSQRVTDWSNWNTPASQPSSVAANSANYAKQNISGFQAQLYDINFGRMQLSSTKDRTYKPGASTYLENTASYQYDPINHQPSFVTTTESNGLAKRTGYTYSCDYSGTSAGILNTLVQNNMLSVPVSVNSLSQDRTSGFFFTLNQKATEYGSTTTGDIKPISNLERRFTQPAFDIPFYDGPGGSLRNGYVQTGSYSYDNNDDLVGSSDEGNRQLTNIYDYNNKFVVASVINANSATDPTYYTSFETSSLGGWSIQGTPSYVTTTAITGVQSVSMTGISLIANTLNTAKTYRLSFWSTTSGISVSTGTLVKSAPTINGFTYYEYSIPKGTVSVAVSGIGYIDELRLCPELARMRTITYDPVIGKTSECDENNRVIYYTYDNLGRLQFIKDEFGSIVKMYEYNTASPACPVTYTNTAIVEHFTKSNCPVGYIGGDVAYTVPANKYTSQLSQLDADAFAENDAEANGQTYADNNGACLQVFTSNAATINYTTQCDEGNTGNTVAYTVPAGAYTSTISQADADAQAQFDANSNGQMYANANGACTVDRDPDWTGNDTTKYSCQVGTGGNPTGHTLALLLDINPNSPSYNQYQWIDIGPDGTHMNCSAPAVPNVSISVLQVLTSPTGALYGTLIASFYQPTIGGGIYTEAATSQNFTINYEIQSICGDNSEPTYGNTTNTGQINNTNITGQATFVSSGNNTISLTQGNWYTLFLDNQFLQSSDDQVCGWHYYSVLPGTGYTPNFDSLPIQ